MNEKSLKELLTYKSADSAEKLKELLDRYGSCRGVFEADICSLSDTLGGDMQTAVYIKLIAAVISRRKCDLFKFGQKHTDEEIQEYFKALFFGLSVETVYVLSIDKAGKVISLDKAGEGTVSSTNVIPRKLLEISKRAGACEVIIAHNHPNGCAKPSDDDVSGTKILRELFFASGIRLSAHYVVAGAECCKIDE